ncbi:hypothetical protein ACIOEW_25900 [Streptomyces sp. NPDC087901]|uniref:hypothetical protein n=1 Tax=Streptomyces sp. NPDC087901 TaxID=3365818 RepID=UPI0037F8EEC1
MTVPADLSLVGYNRTAIAALTAVQLSSKTGMQLLTSERPPTAIMTGADVAALGIHEPPPESRLSRIRCVAHVRPLATSCQG